MDRLRGGTIRVDGLDTFVEGTVDVVYYGWHVVDVRWHE